MTLLFAAHQGDRAVVIADSATWAAGLDDRRVGVAGKVIAAPAGLLAHRGSCSAFAAVLAQSETALAALASFDLLADALDGIAADARASTAWLTGHAHAPLELIAAGLSTRRRRVVVRVLDDPREGGCHELQAGELRCRPWPARWAAAGSCPHRVDATSPEGLVALARHVHRALLDEGQSLTGGRLLLATVDRGGCSIADAGDLDDLDATITPTAGTAPALPQGAVHA
jgi:hypothetical protein